MPLSITPDEYADAFAFEFIDAPPRFNRAEHKAKLDRKYKGKRKEWRAENKDNVYLNRKFVAIDGEGLNVRRGPRRGEHLYVMLAISDREPLIHKDGLATADILDYLYNNLSDKNVNVIYGGSYDFNCWLADLMRDEVSAIYKSKYDGKPVMVHGYALRWMKGKFFSIKRDDRTVTINDVISFFQRPFISACDEYLGEYEGREELVREKAKRGDFKASELKAISHYNQLELRLLVRLMEELRLRLYKVNLRPRRWNSPGAIASALFQREGVKEHRNENLPARVMEAARYAYAGGRFEMIRYGAVQGAAYEYDLRSAYPRALTEVPSLQGGEWVHWKRGDGEMPHSTFALYHVRYKNNNETALSYPAPVFHRGANGNISYPTWSANWVWTPEYEALKDYCETIPGASMFLHEAWLYFPATDYKPFGFIHELYKQRQILKEAEDGAHVGIKLALNSCYGKTAQQVGWGVNKDGTIRVPAYHQLEWAGFVTSWCRAQVLRASMLNPTAIIAFETDAVFSSEPLALNIGTGLGQWDETVFESLTYVQSGHYYGTQITETGKKEIVKCRGVDRGSITREMVEEQLSNPLEADRVLTAPLTRFYGAGIALVRDFPNVWRRWLTEEKKLRLYPVGKREHGACWCDGTAFAETAVGNWHMTFCPIKGSHSNEYPVEWINPDPNMTELAEARESEYMFDD